MKPSKLIIFLLTLILIQGVFAVPILNYISPTPANVSYTSHNYTEINISITNLTDASLYNFSLNWNGTNYSFYDNNLVLAMNFNNNSAIGDNSTHAVDISKYGNNGTLVGGTAWNSSGKFGNALSFDGVDDYVTIPDSNNWNFSNQNFTVGFWGKFNVFTSGVRYTFWSQKSDSSNYMRFQRESNNKLDFHSYANVYNSHYYTTDVWTPSTNIWYYIIFVRNGTEGYIFVDGVLKPTTKEVEFSTIPDYTGSLEIGRGDFPSAGYVNGLIDEVRIFNRALSAEEVALHYQSELSKYNSTEYRFYNNVSNLTDGTYTYYGWANDTLGQQTSSTQQTVTIDTTAPAIDFISPTDTNGTSVSRNYSFVNTSVSDTGSPNNLTGLINWDNSLVGWWRFNNNTGTVAEDFSGYGNTGTLTNMNTGLNNCTGNCSGWNSSGKFGNALSFDGVDDYVNAGSASSLSLPKIGTISLWFKPYTTFSGSTGVAKGLMYGNPREFYFSASTSKLLYFLSDDATGIGSNSGSWNAQWYNVVIVSDGTTLKMFIDGVQQTSTNSIGSLYFFNSTLISPYLKIGGGNFNGTIDEVRIFNRALSAEEINASYNAGLYRLYHNFTGLTDGQHNYTAYVQDLAGNVNSTQKQYVTIDTIYPSYSSISHNQTISGLPTLFTIQYNDTFALHPSGQYIFSTNNTGVWVNDSAINFTSTPQWTNVTKTLNSTAGAVIGYRWYATDNAGNWNNTSIYTLNVVSDCGASQIGNTIYIGSCNNLTQVSNKIKNVSALQYLGNKQWLLNANLVNNNTTNSFYINDTDVLWLKINSTNTSGIPTFWYYLTQGKTEINNTKITSWNTTSNTVENLPVESWARSAVYASGASSKMNISNSNLSYLGYIAANMYGVEYITSSGNIIHNNSFLQNCAGILLYSSSNYNTLTSNIGTSNTNVGIYLYSSSNNNLTNNTGTSTSNHGILLSSSSNNNLTSNIGTSNTYIGIYLYSSSNNNTLTSNIGTSTSYHGIYLYTSSNNNLTSNTGTSNTNVGIYLYSSSNNIMTSNKFNTNSTTTTIGDILVSTSYSNNTFINNDQSKSRKITLYDNVSQFNYSNGSSVFVSTQNIGTALTTLTTNRTLYNWTQSNITFSETWTEAKEIRYNVSGLLPNTGYHVYNGTIIDYNFTTDTNGVLTPFTINFSTSAKTITVLEDNTPPISITSLSDSTYNFGHNWTWVNPVDIDFGYIMIYVNNTFITNITDTYYNISSTSHNTSTISTHTVDNVGNINSTWVNNTSMIPNNPITISNISDTYQLMEGQQLYIDANYYDADSDTSTYDRNFTQGSFDTNTGILTWNTIDGDQGVYNWQINVSDGYGSISTKNFTVTVTDTTPTEPTNIQNSTYNFGVDWNWTKGINSDYTVVQVDGVWKEDSTDNEYNYTGVPHGTYEIELREYNITLGGYSDWNNQTTSIPNNVPILNSIGNKNSNEGLWLNFTVSGTDLDSDVLTCSSDSTKGNLVGCDYSWNITYLESGNYSWIFTVDDGYGGTDSEAINITIVDIPLHITTFWNDMNGWNQNALSLNVGNTVIFNVSLNHTATNIAWKVTGVEEQNTSSLQFTRAFGSVGTFNVTAQAYSDDGISQTIYTVVSVTSGGGGNGTDYDYAYGWVKYSNGSGIYLATVNTTQGTAYTNSNGYYYFGYVFVHGSTYDFEITKDSIYNNKSVTFTSGDYEVVNATLGTSTIVSWGNNFTFNDSLAFTVEKYILIEFNATSNQTMDTWVWTGATQINGSGSTDTYAYRNFSDIGTNNVTVSGTNVYGTTQTITWSIFVYGIENLTLSGYVQNNLAFPLESARVDISGNYTFTDVNGYYSFTNISEENYTVLARAIGYINSSRTVNMNDNITANFTLSEKGFPAIKVSPGVDSIGLIGLIVIVLLWRSKKGKTT